ncbi:MAG: hypothetical protein RLZZ453_41 [Chlamydiota bacterium]|jgi:hypothetical protein
MALTKHQKLARGIKSLLQNLEDFHRKVADKSNVLYFFFSETYLILGRPLMSENTLKAMMETHRYALQRFSPNEKVREAATSAPLIGMVFTPRFYPTCGIRCFPPEAKKVIWHIPWNVQIVLPEENFRKLDEGKWEALLYCPSQREMSEWIDWYEKENKANTLVNQLCTINEHYKDYEPVIRNLHQGSRNHFLQTIKEYLKQVPKVRSRTLEKLEFAPKEKASVAEAYRQVSHSITAGKKRHFMDFQRLWKIKLRRLIFSEVAWSMDKQEALLQELISVEQPKQQHPFTSRWQSSDAIDRTNFGKFILHFADQFLANPLNHAIEGEIVLLLWIMVYIEQNGTRSYSIKRLLELTTENVIENRLVIDGEEIELSEGLALLLKEYIGDQPLKRPQKLFPNLNTDNLAKRFRQASEKILPPGTTPALPEAFLLFPHPHKNVRMPPKHLREQRENPLPIYHDPISHQELKHQLIEKSSNLPS